MAPRGGAHPSTLILLLQLHVIVQNPLLYSLFLPLTPTPKSSIFISLYFLFSLVCIHNNLFHPNLELTNNLLILRIVFIDLRTSPWLGGAQSFYGE